jgi:uncharacterized Zn-binding protein involved in type VI secretion
VSSNLAGCAIPSNRSGYCPVAALQRVYRKRFDHRARWGSARVVICRIETADPPMLSIASERGPFAGEQPCVNVRVELYCRCAGRASSMGQPAARLTDMHTCPMVTGIVPHVGGPITAPGCATVLIGMLPAARVTDIATCVGPPDAIVKGSPTVLIAGLPAARIGDQTAHGGLSLRARPMC